MTASITADRRSTSFFSALGDLLDEEEDGDDDEDEGEEEEEEASLGMDPPRPTTADDLWKREHDFGDETIILASQVAMSERETKLPVGVD